MIMSRKGKSVRHPVIYFWYWLRHEIKTAVKAAIHAIVPPKPSMIFYIDVSSLCNLRCPSCPVGQADEPQARGSMTEDRLRQILVKAKSEFTVSNVYLFNWTEPFLNPKLPALISLVRSFGLKCGISTNLNLLRDADSFVAADPTWVRISVSGFNQEIYSRGHRNGRIERVKENMRLLSEARNRAIAKGMKPRHYEVYYHKYIDNAPEEELMREYALSLGFRFDTVWALLMPVEKVLALADPGLAPIELTPEDHKLIDRLAIPLGRILKSPTRGTVSSCSLQDDFMVLDVEAKVWLCCACSGNRTNAVGNYLDLPAPHLQEKKRAHSLCGPCMALSLPVLGQEKNDPEFSWYGQDAFSSREAYREGSLK
jgi:organic radical activating enzyme